MQDKKAVLVPEATYHVYNRANGSEKLFRSDENYRFFLQKYQEYISPIAETYCYCLMPNHFHLLIRIRNEKHLEEYFINGGASAGSATLEGFKTLRGLQKQEALAKLINQRFSHLFNSYTQAFNKQQQRMGSLFMHPFKRKKVTDALYLRKMVHYIHFNPIESGLTRNPDQWQWSSYSNIISRNASFLNRDEVLEWFGDKENFVSFHSKEGEEI